MRWSLIWVSASGFIAACGGAPPPRSEAAATSPTVSAKCEAGKQATEEHVRAMTTATTRWRMVNDGCPDAVRLRDEQAMPSLDLGTDGYGHPIEVQCTPASTLVRSAGCDGVSGSADDVSSSEPTPARVAFAPPPHEDAPKMPLGDIRVPSGTTVHPAESPGDRVVMQARPLFKSCYSRALTEDPEMSGSIQVDATPSRDGCRLASVTLHKTGTLSDSLVSCLKGAILRVNVCDDGGKAILAPIHFGLMPLD